MDKETVKTLGSQVKDVFFCGCGKYKQIGYVGENSTITALEAKVMEPFKDLKPDGESADLLMLHQGALGQTFARL